MKTLKYLALIIISVYILTFIFVTIKYPDRLLGINTDNLTLTATVLSINDSSDNHTGPGEACDGTDLNGYTCATIAAGFNGGNLACNADRKSYDVSKCVAGNTINVVNLSNEPSCEQIDVQRAIDEATDGDIVKIPVGECVWGNGIRKAQISGQEVYPSIFIDKSIVLIGDDSQNTRLTANIPPRNTMIYINSIIDKKPIRISGLYFDLVNWSQQYALFVNNNIENLQIDNNVFNQGGVSQIFLAGARGVVNNNYFHNGRKAITYMAGSDELAEASWNDLSMGTNNNLFIENNNFIDDNGVDVGLPSIPQERISSENGGKLVIRNNNWDGIKYTTNNTAYSPLMLHGNAIYPGYFGGRSGYRRSQSTIEVYNNIVRANRIIYTFSFRGGSILIYNNSVVTTLGNASFMNLAEEEYYADTQFYPSRTEWPAEDQIHNTFIWNNIKEGVAVTSPGIQAAKEGEEVYEFDRIKKDRDYFMHEPQNIGGKEIFTDRPGAAGTYPSDGSVYPYTGTMIFNSSGPNAYYPYMPYPYPHPLTLIDPTIIPPSPILCTSHNYTDWSACANNTQSHTLISSYPVNCTGGEAVVLSQACTVNIPACTYTDPTWSTCSNSTQTRTRTATNQPCTGDITLVENQSCINSRTGGGGGGGGSTPDIIIPPVTPTSTSTITQTTNTLTQVSTNTATNSNSTICQFIDLLITIQVIAPEKANLARSALNCTTNSVIIPSSSNTNTYTNTSLPPTSGIRASLTINLYPGMRSPQVQTLKKFLTKYGYLSDVSGTDYYGPLTTEAVQKFQIAEHIISSGTPETTGFGAVGPKTREVINKMEL